MPKVTKQILQNAPPPGNRGQILNLNSVKPATALRYQKLLEKFDGFVWEIFRRQARALRPGPELDVVLAEFVNELFWEGEAAHTATALWAAVGSDIQRFHDTADCRCHTQDKLLQGSLD